MMNRIVLKSLVLVTAVAAASLAHAQDASKFPEKPLRLVVPFAAGGPTDVMARLVAAKMGESMGQQVMVENRLGAGGTVATAEVAKSAPDGYTLLFHNVSTAAINQHLYKRLSYDPVKDFQPVSRLADIPNVLIVNRDVPVKSLSEFITYAKANPGKLNYASSGNGTILHLSGELFKQLTGADMVHVPYKGSAPATVDLMAGQITMLFDNMPGQIENIKAGKVKALGVTTAQRVPVLPDLPPLSDAGLATFRNASWFSFFTRAGTPPQVVRRLEQESIKAVNDPAVSRRIRELGAIPVASTAGDLDKFWKAEIEYWRPIVERLNLKLD